ncbi:hypothetical protein H6P81_019081 [Aristolochia fimbriata]|uniref:Uncharacterized protein n=1 Tax=Aristolochia fimbriata TaxID=158543 RepID=A0AAV7DTE2_ARIFI|nr:hypothetical protein H6P81_019081 [Aristolochia fimbriata]
MLESDSSCNTETPTLMSTTPRCIGTDITYGQHPLILHEILTRVVVVCGEIQKIKALIVAEIVVVDVILSGVFTFLPADPCSPVLFRLGRVLRGFLVDSDVQASFDTSFGQPSLSVTVGLLVTGPVIGTR